MQSETSEPVAILLEGGGLHFSENINRHQAAQIIAFLSQSVNPMPFRSSFASEEREEGATRQIPEMLEPLTPRQYLLRTSAKTNPQKILVLGRYFEEFEKSKTENCGFTLEDIRRLFERAKERKPAQLGRDLRAAIQNCWIDTCGDSNEQYLVLTEGLEALEADFKGIGTPKNGSSPRKSAAVSIGETVSEEVKNAQILPEMSGLPRYADQPSKALKALWILVAAHEVGISSLTPNEINFIALKKLADTPFSNVHHFLKQLKAEAYVYPQDNSYIPVAKGIDKIKNPA